MQFGVWQEHLSIDEQMVPFFGRHSCKMYIHGKPIRFGFKLWCMCSSGGYLYQALPYSGAYDTYDKKLGLGSSVIMSLVDLIEFPARHQLYFDNFFTSYHLMCLLTERRMCATGTVRPNRTAGADAQMAKNPPTVRGEMRTAFDSVNKVLITQWMDSKSVMVATNFDQVEPQHNVTRWQKKVVHNNGMITPGYMRALQQPHVIRNYNRHMGGVDLHDNSLQNYRINIRSKRWWWPIFIAQLDSAMVNAWRLHCFVAQHEKKATLRQKVFRVDVTRQLLQTEDEDFVADVGEYAYNGPAISGKHIIIKSNVRARCAFCKVNQTIHKCASCNKHLHAKCFSKFNHGH